MLKHTNFPLVLKLIRVPNLMLFILKPLALITEKGSVFGGIKVGESLSFENVNADCQSSGAKVYCNYSCG